MNYIEAVKLLTSEKRFRINLGLDRILKILNLLGNPQEKTKVIHTAGTNGKGSVCAVLANILKCNGYKTGLYTSPHLLKYTERIRINGQRISENDFAGQVEYIWTIAEKNNIGLTEFEILTAAAFKYFAGNNTDYAVIETGLGGRFDASNVCSEPVCSIITSISLDHTDRLGGTIEQIAFEKAGIIKKGCPVIISEQNSGYAVIKEHAQKIGSELITVKNEPEIIFENGVNYAVTEGVKYEFPLLGLYQKQNLALVLEAVKLLGRSSVNLDLSEGLKTAAWPGRLEYIKDKNLLIDGAHNPDAAKELKKSLEYYFPKQKRIFIYGTINTKDYKTIARILFNPEDEIYYCEFPHPNAVSFAEYRRNIQFLKNLKPFSPDILNGKELKILTGSLYMTGFFMSRFHNTGAASVKRTL